MLISTYDGLTREEMATLRSGTNAGQIAIQTEEASATALSTIQHVGPDPKIEKDDTAETVETGGAVTVGALIAAGAAFFMFR